MFDYPWCGDRQELLATPSEPGRWKRIVACLNVWNDIDELTANFSSWYPYVDHVIVVDGEYGTGQPSDDGTLEYLANFGEEVTVVGPYAWEAQQHKRNAYLADDLCSLGDLLFIIDADEYVTNGEVIREVPYCDVGWVTFTSPVYKRPQHTPRFIRWQPGLKYAGRHHWLTHLGKTLCTHQQGGAGYDHRLVPLHFHNSRGAKRTPERRAAVNVSRQVQVEDEFKVGERVLGHEPLRIFQTGPFDPGNVVYRLHTAINTTSPHESAMATGDLGPFNPPRQYEFEADRLVLKDLAMTSDVVHYHVMRVADKYLGVNLDGRPTVMHHHGTEYRRDPLTWNERDRAVDVRLVSNLELLQYGEGLTYLPNPVPVERYRRFALAASPQSQRLRIAHSPTKQGIKGTEVFLRVCRSLEMRRLVEAVLIQNEPLHKALEIKATCDVCFDSFFLGMQCSGLEAAAMGMPVIAGDADCRREYNKMFGCVPYTFADDETALKAIIERLATDPKFYATEQARVSTFVTEFHDYAAVVRTYLDILNTHFHWRDGLELGKETPLRVAA